MAPIALQDLISSLPTEPSWGPPSSTETTLDGVPYAPFSKGDKLGRMADWTAGGQDRDRGARQPYGRNYRDQQIYGAQSASIFSVQAAEDESTFSVVDNTRTTRGRGFGGRGGAAVFRGRGAGRGAAGARGAAQGGRGTFQRVGRGGQQQQQFNDSQRGGGRGRGGRRFGWKDYDKPQRNRDASVNVKADWALLEEIDFLRLSKLNLEAGQGEELAAHGFLHAYDRSLDKQPGTKVAEKRLNVLDRAAYNVTTSSDPVIQDLAASGAAQVFATDNILSMLMCSPRSVYSWDLIIERRGSNIFIDKREGSALDMVSVNENAADAPLELSEGNKDSINAPGALMLEATHINNIFPLICVSENESTKKEMPNAHPFYSREDEAADPASKAYRYLRFDLSSENAEQPLHLVVRTELDAHATHPVTHEPQLITIHALNEFDNKAQGSGGALDWRTKLASQRGAVVATEMKNNSSKLARWTTQAILANADLMKLGFISRVSPRDTGHHVVLGVLGYKPREFAGQMNLNVGNGWGIVRSIVDMVMRLGDSGKENAKYVLVKDPNKALLRLYEVPMSTFGDGEDEDEEVVEEPKDGEGEKADEK
ncbi:MAG: hypothetical protein Q9162_002843 [Coniocarpon cinnabarinum]